MTEIDPAKEVEIDALLLQKPMNNVIDRGDSPIQQLYSDKCVFITGGCGFMGKHLIEKLFRATKLKKIFVLIRPKKGCTIQSRIDSTLSNPVYDTLHKIQPDFAERLVPIEGDIGDFRLGISDADWKLLTEEVNIIFHAAATIRFHESIRKATLTNVRGTREVLQLAKECKNLIKLVHVSTAFAQATRDNINNEVLEEFSKCPIPPHSLISLAENVDEKRLNSITMNLIDGWPNTYTFTKAVAEELIRTTAGNLPVCIVRPCIVLPAYYEPAPGWLDLSTLLAGPSGFYFGSIIGVLHVLYCDISKRMAMAPVDLANNAIIASVCDSTERRKAEKKDIPIYTVANQKRYMSVGLMGTTLRQECLHLVSPKTVWYIWLFETKYFYLYKILSLFVHYIPAYFLDFIFKFLIQKPKALKDVSSFADIYRKVDKLAHVYEYFLFNEWNFRDDNIQDMMKRMSPADKAIFNCDLMTLNLNKYIKIWGIGLRKYIIQDELKGSAEGTRWQKIYKVMNYTILSLFVYILWLIFSTIFNFVVRIFV